MSDLFADLLGQERAVTLLDAALERRRLAPAYLFAGADGVGRRLAALRFLEGVVAGSAGSSGLRRRLEQGNHPDLLWVEPTFSHQGRLVPASRALEEGVSRRTPPQLRLEQVREISRVLARRPVESPAALVCYLGLYPRQGSFTIKRMRLCLWSECVRPAGVQANSFRRVFQARNFFSMPAAV